MIGYIRGNILEKKPSRIIIEANGVGYSVNIPLSTYYTLTDREYAELHIYTRVREDDLSLYGFATLEEKDLFEKLISISGIGPKLALTLLSGLPIDELYDTIERQDAKRLHTIPGIGSKTSERIILEMKDKIKRRPERFLQPISAQEEIKTDLIAALTNLGYNPNESRNTVDKVLMTAASKDLATLLKECLKVLNKSG
jgi:holliday junction DNA helicase RuvA